LLSSTTRSVVHSG